MLKTRIMPTLLYKDTTLVKGVGFDSWRRVGSLMQAVKVYNLRQVDELVFLDISATLENRDPDYELIDEFADECFVPLSVGGGIRSVSQVRRLLEVGADKIVLNTAATENPDLIADIAGEFGSQCVVASMDFRRLDDGTLRVFSHSGRRATGWDLEGFARIAAANGAGELLLTSIDRDGTFQGYDLDAIRRVSDAVSVPVIASGGAGSYEHMRQAIAEARASAIAAASMFHFSEQTPLEAKRYLHDNGISTRMWSP